MVAGSSGRMGTRGAVGVGQGGLTVKGMGELRQDSSAVGAVTSLVSKTCDLEDCCRALSIVDLAGRSHHEGRRLPL